jgi:DNA-binding CsgD family transcriptional regulator
VGTSIESGMPTSAFADASFAQPVAALGGLAFASELLAALNQRVPVDHVCLMRFADRNRPPVLESASWRGGNHVGAVQNAFLAGLYRHDPNLALKARTGVAVHHLHRSAITNDAYRETCYQSAGLIERLTVAATVAGQLIALNLYRLESTGAFTAEESRVVEALAPLLAALAIKHVSVMGMQLRSRDRQDRIDALCARLHATSCALTERERTVLARVLMGMTSHGIALDLGVALSTVLTYRKRAYARLGVTSQAELFALMV